MGLKDVLSVWAGRGRVRCHVLVLGLDGAGKTSLLRALAPPEPQPVNTAATDLSSGANAAPREEHFQSGGVAFTACDVPGAARLRALWERHYRRANAVIFVVDASDHLRLVVAREELALLVAHPDMASRRVPLLVLAHKSDRPRALTPTALAQALCLERITDRAWHVCASSAPSAPAADGIAWLSRQLREQHTHKDH